MRRDQETPALWGLGISGAVIVVILMMVIHG